LSILGKRSWEISQGNAHAESRVFQRDVAHFTQGPALTDSTNSHTVSLRERRLTFIRIFKESNSSNLDARRTTRAKTVAVAAQLYYIFELGVSFWGPHGERLTQARHSRCGKGRNI
jgi:hypothetical protein